MSMPDTPTPPSPEPPRCEHRGAFTGAQCIKPQGHNGEHFHDYIPLPEPPREREGEPCDICGRTKAMHQGPERFCPIIASYRAAPSEPPGIATLLAMYDATHGTSFAAASLPPSAGTINSSPVDSSLIDGPETREPDDYGADAKAMDRDRQNAQRAVARQSAPPAGSGETVDEVMQRVARVLGEFDEADAVNLPVRYSVSPRFINDVRQLYARLAAHPAGTTREEGWVVHNHGPSEGKGLSCPEYRLNGRLIGACLHRPPTPEAP